jgi:hypothetical protein
MSWRIRRTLSVGPLKTSISKKGLGHSFGFFGLRFGVTAEGRRYWSFGIKGTGFYYIKYIN